MSCVVCLCSDKADVGPQATWLQPAHGTARHSLQPLDNTHHIVRCIADGSALWYKVCSFHLFRDLSKNQLSSIDGLLTRLSFATLVYVLMGIVFVVR